MYKNFSEAALLQRYPFRHDHDLCLIDVGAHHGYFSRPFAAKDWKVLAFEAEARNFAMLQQKLGDFPKATLINRAVSDVHGAKVPFYVSDEHFGIHSLNAFHPTHRLAQEVETVRLDAIVDQMQLATVDLIKVDVEGADFLVLKSFDFTRHQPEIVMVEFMDSRSLPNFSYTYHDMVSYMQPFGYVAYVSAWQEIKEYAREGEPGEPHTWIECRRDPLGYDPAWGNLIFVTGASTQVFERTLESYLKNLRRGEKGFPARLRRWARNVPVLKRAYHAVKKGLGRDS